MFTKRNGAFVLGEDREGEEVVKDGRDVCFSLTKKFPGVFDAGGVMGEFDGNDEEGFEEGVHFVLF